MKLQILTISFAIIFFLTNFNQVRRKKLNAKFGLVWALLSVGLVVLSLFLYRIMFIANCIGIKTVSNMIFLIGFIFFLFLTLNITKSLSAYETKIIELTQELAILKKEIKEKELSE